jgi:hypothetical protein
LYLSIERMIKHIVVIIGAHHFSQPRTKLYPISSCQDLIHMQWKLLGIINVDFDTIGQLLIIYVYNIFSNETRQLYLLFDLNKFSFWKREVPRLTKCYTLRRPDR